MKPLPAASSEENPDGKKDWLIKELRTEYAECSEFFDDNEEKILSFPWFVKSERELRIFRERFENTSLPQDLGHRYNSSSVFAAEDTLIELIDLKRALRAYLLEINPDLVL